ncbi:hypothetical protein SBBP1_60034 [Burkholderiales bacterium]|nr:hypothetical protein SBBP1_60034 [Burkholderiales bacterium]
MRPTAAGAAALRSGARPNRARGIGDPLAPGSGKQCGALQPRQVQREQIMAGGHARAALDAHRVGRPAAQDRLVFGSQLGRLLKSSTFGQVPFPEAVDGAGYVAGYRVDGLVAALVAVGGTRIEQQSWRAGCRGRAARGNGIDPDDGLKARPHREVPGLQGRLLIARRVAGRDPRRPSPVKDRNVGVSQPAQQPPRPRRIGALAGVIGNDPAGVSYAPGPQACRHCGGIRQGMASTAGGPCAGEVAVQMGENGSRDMALPVLFLAQIGLRQVMATVEYANVGRAQRATQGRNVDDPVPTRSRCVLGWLHGCPRFLQSDRHWSGASVPARLCRKTSRGGARLDRESLEPLE